MKLRVEIGDFFENEFIGFKIKEHYKYPHSKYKWDKKWYKIKKGYAYYDIYSKKVKVDKLKIKYKQIIYRI